MDAFIVLVKLLCAHLCADFIFQTDSINKGKRKSGGKGIAYNLLHSLIHAGAAYLFVANVSYWFIPIIVFVTHFVIDWIKCRFCEDNLPAFLVDQFMHIAIICILWFVFFGKEVDYTLQERRLFDDSFAVNEVSLSRGVFQGLEIMRFITEDAALAVS